MNNTITHTNNQITLEINKIIAHSDIQPALALLINNKIKHADNHPEQSVREAADFGRPAALQEGTALTTAFAEITRKLVSQVLLRNNNLPPTKAVEITNLVGCEAIKN